MVSTESADEYTFIKSNFDGSIGWLGATDSAPDSIWRWDSGTAVLAFINWAPNEPDSSESNCDCMAVNVDAYNSWLWDDKNCDNMYRSICEKVL